MTRTAVALLFVLALTPFASAHPIPNSRYDRTVAVRVAPDHVAVRYTLEVNEFTMPRTGGRADL